MHEIAGLGGDRIAIKQGMMMTKIRELAQLGQAIWLDYIRRSFTDSGGLGKLVDQGLRGVTSNPSIFEKAIAGSTDYDEDLLPLIEAGKTTEEIYEALALDDIRKAADLLRPMYEQTGGGGRVCQPRGQPPTGTRYRGYHCSCTQAVPRIGQAQCDDQGPRHRRGSPGH